MDSTQYPSNDPQDPIEEAQRELEATGEIPVSELSPRAQEAHRKADQLRREIKERVRKVLEE